MDSDTLLIVLLGGAAAYLLLPRQAQAANAPIVDNSVLDARDAWAQNPPVDDSILDARDAWAQNGGMPTVDVQPYYYDDMQYDQMGNVIGVGWSNDMTPISSDLLAKSANVRAFLTLIRTGEGTLGANGYRTLYGGSLFGSFADHPRVSVTASGRTSTAAGAYQILSKTWDDLLRAGYRFPDFSPSSQDMAALALIKRRDALGDVIAGRFTTAISKANREWASLPGSPYGQPTLSLSQAIAVLAQAGGQSNTMV